MSEENILVSISCITYNHEKYIKQTIDSFLNQKTNFKYEILIHDDASTDGTQKILKEYQEKFPEIIKTILREENQYSKGVKRISYLNNDLRANGKYIAMCEGDDYWNDENKLQEQVDILEKDNNISFCFTEANLLDTMSNEIKDVQRAYRESCYIKMSDLIRQGGAFCPTASIIYRRSMVEEMPEFFFNSHVGDYPLQLILGFKGEGYYIDKPMVTYRVNTPGSWSSKQNNKNKIKTMENDIELLEEFNNYTGTKFNEDIQYKINECEFWIEYIEADIKKLKSKKYTEFYSRIGMLGKIKLYVRHYLPNVSIKLFR
nr:glycosyltransferase [Clostridium chrysemydis]